MSVVLFINWSLRKLRSLPLDLALSKIGVLRHARESLNQRKGLGKANLHFVARK